MKGVQEDQLCPVATELDVLEAMTRRSLAFDLVGLIDFETFQRWNQHLFQILRQAAPPGFKQPNVTQLLRADRQAFVRTQELSRDGVKPRADWTRHHSRPASSPHSDVLHVASPSSNAAGQSQAGQATDKIPRLGKQLAKPVKNLTPRPPRRCGRKTRPRGYMYPSGGKLPIALKDGWQTADPGPSAPPWLGGALI